MKDKCVICNTDTQYDEFDHIDFRNFYVEGAGQLCCECFNEIYNEKIHNKTARQLYNA